jgi:DNA-binding beta-propeller fold protein YncE
MYSGGYYSTLDLLSNPLVSTGFSTDIVGESFDPNNGDLYVWANYWDSPVITVLNASTLKTVTTITDPNGSPTAISFDSANNTAYVAQTNDEITLINSTTNTIDGHLVLPSTLANYGTEAVVANPATHSVYLLNTDYQSDSNYYLLVLNDATNQVSQTPLLINYMSYPGGEMLLNPRTNAIYISGPSTYNGAAIVDVFTPTSS